MSSVTLYALLLVAGLGMVAVTGCEEPGPLEKAGKKVDKSMEDAADKTEELMDKAEKKVKESTDG